MKRFLISAALIAAAAGASPAQAAGAEVVFCGFTPPVPCGVCVIDDRGERTCVVTEESR